MRKRIYFCNNGGFDLSAMLTFGVSAKESSDSIGKFGTGFKYAVAITLRLGGEILVRSGDEEYNFSYVEKVIRGKSFNVVTVNGKEAGFTTALGSHWEPWQAFRELYCNCLDESGITSDSPLDQFDTIIEVACEQIYLAYQNKSNYFIESTPIYADRNVEIHNDSRPYFYYKGVAVCRSGKSIYSYNILRDVDLTEDRTAKYPHHDIERKIAISIATCDDPKIIEDILLSRLEYDNAINYSASSTASSEFISKCRQLISSDRCIPEAAFTLLNRLCDEAGEWPEVELNNVEQAMIDKSVAFLRALGEPVDDYDIKTVKGLGDNCMGRAFDGRIYLSKIPFQLGTKQVASTILEEYVHLKHGCPDFSREIQSWLFDKILSIGESINGEPL
ncbi:MAG TPA: hypothetical protein DCZ03_02270 [Gammaproteobacteria bacterium]|nr:hypothetical protein [Gammaproteobacteria bacterium]